MKVTAKRKQLELILEQNDEIILFISCITGQEKGAPTKRKRKQEKEDSDDDEKGDDSNDNDADLTPNTSDTPNKAIYPGLTFWIVMETPQACVNDVQTNRMKIMLQSGLEIDSCKPIVPREKKIEWRFTQQHSVKLLKIIPQNMLQTLQNILQRDLHQYQQCNCVGY